MSIAICDWCGDYADGEDVDDEHVCFRCLFDGAEPSDDDDVCNQGCACRPQAAAARGDRGDKQEFFG